MPDVTPERRLDGWKAIANYFRRDRTTVMRWARDRDMPVHRMPGGVQGSVFAFEHELARWALPFSDVDASGIAPDADPAPPAPAMPVAPSDAPTLPTASAEATPPARSARRWVGLALILLLGLGAVLISQSRSAQPTADAVAARAALPVDPAIAADYAAARDLWAQRTAPSLRQSIALYRRVIARAPEFAPGHVGLAEAWLISREYSDATEAQAYGNAQESVDRALSIDPDLASAHRAQAFILYWWHDKARESDTAFRRALALDPQDGLTHFWYANMLADRGDYAAATRAYDRARVLLPGTPAIEVERACADWQAGRDALAIARLSELATRRPGDATVHNCLAWAHISVGDIASYAREYRETARLRGEPRMLAVADRLDAAVARDPATAHRVLIDNARQEFATGARQTRITPAFFASAMGDRDALLPLMREAVVLGENWYSVNLTRRIAARWPRDAEIQRLLARLHPEDRPLR